MRELIGLTLDAARAELGDAPLQIVETVAPLGPKSPLLGATENGALRVLRARRTDDSRNNEGWELLVAREQTRD
jgi:hypothetical protein